MMNRSSRVFIGLMLPVLAGCTLSSGYNHPYHFDTPWNWHSAKSPSPQPQIVSPTAIITQSVPVGAFDSVEVTGRLVNVNIEGRTPVTQVSLQGPYNKVRACQISVLFGKLMINCPMPFNSSASVPVDITIQTANDLNKITFNAYGNLALNNIGYSGLILNVGGHSSTTITGNNILLQKINASGSSTINAYWLNNQNIKIFAADRARVTVAGTANHLDAIVSGNAVLNARYLRVDDAFVRTAFQSTAYIYVRHLMSTWSTEQSTVFYYRDPDFGAPYMAASGAELRMKGLPPRY